MRTLAKLNQSAAVVGKWWGRADNAIEQIEMLRFNADTPPPTYSTTA